MYTLWSRDTSYGLPVDAPDLAFRYACRTNRGSSEVSLCLAVIYVYAVGSRCHTFGSIRHVSFSAAGDAKNFFDYIDS